MDSIDLFASYKKKFLVQVKPNQKNGKGRRGIFGFLFPFSAPSFLSIFSMVGFLGISFPAPRFILTWDLLRSSFLAL
jgi:hypothetical protein